MRTTIDLTNDQRATLLGMAAQRGMRGYSPLIREALEHYLQSPHPSRRTSRPRHEKKSPPELIAWLDDGFTTGRRDGAERHDDYIYRNR